MINLPLFLIILGISSGQLIKLPITSFGGLTVLDLSVVTLVFWGFLKRKFVNPPFFIKSGLFFVAIASLSLILSPLKLSLNEYFSSSVYILRFFLYILLGWLVFIDRFPDFTKKIGYFLILSGIILSILGLLQFIFLPDLRFVEINSWDPHYFRTASTFLDPNFLGSFLVLTLILILNNVWITFKKNGAKHLQIGFFLLVYFTLLTTFSRGAYLAFLISFLTISILNKSLKQFFLVVFLFLILMGGFYAYVQSVAAPLGINRGESATFRFNTWQQGLTIFEKKPIWGVGFNAYRYAIRDYNLGSEQFLKSRGSSTNDSSLLFVLATTGVIGLTTYFLFLFSIYKTGWLSYIRGNKSGLSLIAGMSALLTQSFFANTLFYPPLLIWIILVSVKSLALEAQKR